MRPLSTRLTKPRGYPAASLSSAFHSCALGGE